MGDGQGRIVVVKLAVGDALLRLQPEKLRPVPALLLVREGEIVRQDKKAARLQCIAELAVQWDLLLLREMVQ